MTTSNTRPRGTASAAALTIGGPQAAGFGTDAEVFRLIVQGQDRPGIVTAVAGVLSRHGGNIVSLKQHSSSASDGQFFQRLVFGLVDADGGRNALEADLDRVVAGELGLSWTLHEATARKRVAIFASKTDHCLLDLLWRARRNEIPMDVVMVVSNHHDLATEVADFGIPFVHVPVSGDKSDAEREHLRLLEDNVDLVVLARYMQIISADFLQRVGVPVINIHHSFLPAFIGAGPYQKAKERGVKLVGATAHYVTEDLDEGPIIEQDVVRVTHSNTVQDLVQRGADIERVVLSRAVRWHCEDRVLRDGNQTVVFTP